MEKREIISSKSMTIKIIIVNILLTVFVFIGISLVVGSILALIFSQNNNNNNIDTLYKIIVSLLTIITTWKLSVSMCFKKYTIYYKDIKKLIKNLFIFVIILSLISFIFTFAQSKKELNREINSIKKINYYSNYISDSKTDEYTQEKTIKELNNKLFINLLFSGLSNTTIEILILFLVAKKDIEKYSIE